MYSGVILTEIHGKREEHLPSTTRFRLSIFAPLFEIEAKVTKLAVAVLALILILMPPMTSAETPIPGPQPRKFTSAIDHTEQPYNLFVPSAAADGKPVPLVIALHGHGATWESWFKGTKVCEWAEKEGYAVLCPHGRGNYFYLGIGETDVWEALADVRKNLSIDDDRIYLIGHSMGGWGTWNIAASRPDVFAAIVPMSSWAPLELLENVQYLNPLIIHGDNDPAVDVQRSRDADATLTKLGIAHRYIELPGVGHESSMISDMLPTIGDHIRGRRRTKAPSRIAINSYTRRRDSAYWLTIRGAVTDGRKAHVGASLETNALTFDYADDLRFDSILVDLGNEAFAPLAGSDLVLRFPGGATQTIPAKVMKSAASSAQVLAIHSAGNKAEIAPREVLRPPANTPIAKGTSPAADVTGVIAQFILADTKVDGVFMSPSMFLPSPPTGDISYDDMFDYITRMGGVTRENEGSGIFSVTGADLVQKLADQKEWKPSWWENVKCYPEVEFDEAKSYRILVPPPLLSAFKKGFPSAKPLDVKVRDLRQIIMEAVMTKGEL